MPHTLDVARLGEVFDQLLSEDRLTKWEQGFVESVHEQWLARGTLSEKQLETFEKIYVKY
jgi:hypothetical protein